MGCEEYQRTRVFGSLDGLRALAILAVIWHHTVGVHATAILARRGFLGVDLFFVISGFLIATLLLREDQAKGAIKLGAFYCRRCLRILPAYWLMLAIVFVSLLRHESPRLEHELPYAALYVSNFVPMTTLLSITWSLSTEEQFYLVIPAIMRFCRSAMIWLLPVLYIASELPAFGLWPNVHLSGFLRQTTFAPIVLGVMLAYALNEPRVRRVLYPLVGSRAAAPLALILAIALCSMSGGDISGLPRLLMQCSFALLVACCVLREDNGLEPLLTFPIVRRIGTVSYGMYLYHLLLYGVAQDALRHLHVAAPLMLFVVLAAFTFCVAEVSYRWYETPFLRLRYRSVERVDRPIAAV